MNGIHLSRSLVAYWRGFTLRNRGSVDIASAETLSAFHFLGFETLKYSIQPIDGVADFIDMRYQLDESGFVSVFEKS